MIYLHKNWNHPNETSSTFHLQASNTFAFNFLYSSQIHASHYAYFLSAAFSFITNYPQVNCFLLKSPLYDGFHAIHISCWFFYRPQRKKMINHKRKMLLHFHDLMLCCFLSLFILITFFFSTCVSDKSSKEKYESDGRKKKQRTKKWERKATWNSIKVEIKMSSLLRCVTWVFSLLMTIQQNNSL